MHDLGFAQRICTWRILKLREKSGNFILVDLGRYDGLLCGRVFFEEKKNAL